MNSDLRFKIHHLIMAISEPMKAVNLADTKKGPSKTADEQRRLDAIRTEDDLVNFLEGTGLYSGVQIIMFSKK